MKLTLTLITTLGVLFLSHTTASAKSDEVYAPQQEEKKDKKKDKKGYETGEKGLRDQASKVAAQSRLREAVRNDSGNIKNIIESAIDEGTLSLEEIARIAIDTNEDRVNSNYLTTVRNTLLSALDGQDPTSLTETFIEEINDVDSPALPTSDIVDIQDQTTIIYNELLDPGNSVLLESSGIQDLTRDTELINEASQNLNPDGSGGGISPRS